MGDVLAFLLGFLLGGLVFAQWRQREDPLPVVRPSDLSAQMRDEELRKKYDALGIYDTSVLRNLRDEKAWLKACLYSAVLQAGGRVTVDERWKHVPVPEVTMALYDAANRQYVLSVDARHPEEPF